MSAECQTDESFLSDEKVGSSSQKQEPVSPEGSAQPEVSGEQEADIQKDDTAPKPEPAKRLYYDVDITGNEDDSVFRKLEQCFPDGHNEWAGFYGQGYPGSTKHRHMFWHVKYRKTQAPHKNHWYTDTDDQLMTEYIARRKNEYPLSVLQRRSETHVNMVAVILDFIHNNRNTQRSHQRMQNPELPMISIP